MNSLRPQTLISTCTTDDACTTSGTMARAFSSELLAVVHKDHIALNKLITSRLPLCLPPCTDSPLLYAQGLTVFGQIFALLERHLARELRKHASQDRILRALRLLDIPGLYRTERLQRDIDEVRQRLGEAYDGAYDMPREVLDLCNASSHRLSAKPRLILAHAWAMYLALFNGGRWIRKQLRDAGEAFWRGMPPLSFWEFEGVQDGNDVHAQFKRNFELAAPQLTSEEWTDVVQETKQVFALCARLVAVLDGDSANKMRTTCERTVDRGAGLNVRLWRTYEYVGLVCLLVAVCAFLLAFITTRKD